MKKIYLLVITILIGSWAIAQKPISKANWQLIEVDSEELTGEGAGNGVGICAIDEDLSTFWHTNWTSTSDPYPHHITIDLGQSYDMLGMQYTARAGRTEGVPDTLSVWTSGDNVSWDSITGMKLDAPISEVTTLTFTNTARYIKVVGNSGQGSYLHMVCAEIDVLVAGTNFSSDITKVMRHNSVTFTDESGNSPLAWEWIFEGGTPATSTDQNPTVSYSGMGSFDVTLISKPVAGDDTQNDTLKKTNYISTYHTAAFKADKNIVNPGEAVTFSDTSLNSPVARKWEFPGGTPATSTDENPVVTFTQAGNYDIKLISITVAGDDTKNDTLVKTAYVTVDIPNVSQETWSLVYVDSEKPEALAVNVFDGDPSTIWHDNWGLGDAAPTYPHTLIIDLGATHDLSGFSYTPRAGGGNGTISEYQMYITKELPSNDFGPSWGTVVHQGQWTAPWDPVRNEFFANNVIGRYVIFYPLSDGRADDSNCTCAELNMKGSLYGAAFKSDKTEIFATQSIQFTDLSAGMPAGWEWTFEGGTPATSTDQNPKVKYTAGDTLDVQLVMTPQSGVTSNDTILKKDMIIVKDLPTTRSLVKDNWELIKVDSEEPSGEGDGNGLGIHAIDGDPASYWHTDWATTEPVHPHYLIIDLHENVNMVGFEYVPRDGGGNGTVAQYELLSSIDAETFTLADSGTWADNWADTRTQMFDAPINGRFVKFTAKSEKAGGAWTSCGELNILVEIEGAEFGASATVLEKSDIIDFIDFSAGNPTTWAWTFEGGTPATSTEQSPSGIQYDVLGTYEVALTTTGGTDNGTMTKTGYISVDYADVKMGYNGVIVDTVELGKVLLNTSPDSWMGGNVDYVDMKTNVYRNETYKLRVSHYNPWGDHEARNQRAWIDWNNNGRYEESELVLDSNDPVDVIVPADAVLGETQMRVATMYHEPTSANPYAGISDGETEDYTLVIGELSVDAPVAAFESNITGVCSGYMVEYTDLSSNTPTSWAWTFEGGTPATSDMKNPIVYYETAGLFDASLTASQTSGSDDEVKADFITVSNSPTVSAGDDINACFGEEITLSGTGADTYVWENDVVDGTAFTPSTMDYVVTGTDAQGCVATDTVSVTVEAEIDYTVTPGDHDAIVDAVGATFQWIDCADNSDIAGATSPLFEPEVTGSYAVVVTVGECNTTSDCVAIEVVGVDNSLSKSIKIYPNPTNGVVNIAINNPGASIRIVNMLGSTIYLNENASSIEQINLNTQGLYIIEIQQNNQIYTGKLVIE